jgi:hypothetical protein
MFKEEFHCLGCCGDQSAETQLMFRRQLPAICWIMAWFGPYLQP